jgi:hypothetical protein
MIKVEFQYFDGCPNSDLMMERVKEAISQINAQVEFNTILIDTPEKAKKYNFRGSPTVLINGIDLVELPEPNVGNLACRYYSNGIPSVKSIINSIKDKEKLKGK